MNKIFAQVLGVALLVLGAQGVGRLLVDHDDAGLLGWLPGGFPTQLIIYILIGLAGGWLATVASRKAA